MVYSITDSIQETRKMSAIYRQMVENTRQISTTARHRVPSMGGKNKARSGYPFLALTECGWSISRRRRRRHLRCQVQRSRSEVLLTCRGTSFQAFMIPHSATMPKDFKILLSSKNGFVYSLE